MLHTRPITSSPTRRKKSSSSSSISLRMKMGKKTDKGKDKNEKNEDDPSKSPEPYVATGNFEVDFTELCKRSELLEAPAVLLRPKMPIQMIPETKGKKASHVVETVVQNTDDPDGADKEPPPTTYVLKNKFEYLKPSIQVEMDNPDKKSTLNHVYVRGWKIDSKMMNIFRLCFPACDRLHTLTFWNAGMTDETLEILSNFLPSCENLKHVNIEGSPVKNEMWHSLICEGSKITHLKLRNNSITDRGAMFLGKTLGNCRKINSVLTVLNLSFNHIGPEGAKHLASGLRMNRSLLCLNLNGNSIKDDGAIAFSVALNRFALTHEEVVERRIRMREQMSPERKSPPSSRKGERPTSKGPAAQGGSTDRKSGNKGVVKGAKTNKEGTAEKDKKEQSSKGGKSQPDKNKKATAAPDNKGNKRKGTTPKGGRTTNIGDNENNDSYEFKHPLDEEYDYSDGDLWIKVGNRALISLNLNRNGITDVGCNHLLKAIQYQTTIHAEGPRNAPIGLLRLTLSGNQIPTDSTILSEMQRMLAAKDPLRPPPPKSPDDDSQSVISNK